MSMGKKVKTVDFSETIAACDLKVGRCRQLIEIMKVCESVILFGNFYLLIWESFPIQKWPLFS